jgi:predicted dehydrogenase
MPAKSNLPLLRVGLIGAGLRATAYFRNLPSELRERVRLAAVVDPSPKNRKFFIERFGDESSQEYDSAEEFFAGEPMDGIIIASPNRFHAEQLIAALDWNVPILLEKPVCISLEECRAVWEAYENSARPLVAVGFVLRYTPFYQRVHEIVRSGILGQILQVDADELLGAAQTSAFFRESWRLHDRLSGGFFVEKCCHDIDVLSLIAGSKVRRIGSFAARSHFLPRPRSEQHARFDASVTRRLASDYADLHVKKYFENISDESVYHARGDVPDHQSVLIQYENDILTAFSVTFGQPRQTRRIRIMGSNGQLSGDIQKATIEYDIGEPGEDRWTNFCETVAYDQSGHSGGDSRINGCFWNALSGGPVEILAGLEDGLEAVLAAICVEESKLSGTMIDVQSIREEIFGKVETAGV